METDGRKMAVADRGGADCDGTGKGVGREWKLPAYPPTSPSVDRLVTEIIGRVADRWTMLVLETLTEHGELRFSRLADLIEGVSQKMLTQTLRGMERDGLVHRTVHPVVPPHVDYCLTDLGTELSGAFCGVWLWAEKNYGKVQAARNEFDATPQAGVPKARVEVARG